MAFNINDFRSSFNNFEPASPANYEVIITRDPFIEQSFGAGVVGNAISTDMTRQLMYRCESCSLPSRDLVSTNRMTYGMPKKVVSGSVFNNVSFSFIVSDDMSEKHYFYQWQNAILNNEANSFQDNPNVNDVAYYDSYTGDILINTYSKFGDLKYSIYLVEAYPISVQEVQLGWNNTNDYIRVNVTMAYRYFYENTEDVKGINAGIRTNIKSDGANRVNLNKSKVKTPFLE